ncbi:hypothetical protein AVEN_172341-1 [Araneus ventricosus]|uniref:Uncharacterized protein n=1 Tax=Araneus ventricosus TaxID=182803 RepID=A0A4Y2E5B0_ARAVE|nr:hypothetical protein AVEN_172341-1 [Araneus ventricosus]
MNEKEELSNFEQEENEIALRPTAKQAAEWLSGLEDRSEAHRAFMVRALPSSYPFPKRAQFLLKAQTNRKKRRTRPRCQRHAVNSKQQRREGADKPDKQIDVRYPYRPSN